MSIDQTESGSGQPPDPGLPAVIMPAAFKDVDRGPVRSHRTTVITAIGAAVLGVLVARLWPHTAGLSTTTATLPGAAAPSLPELSLPGAAAGPVDPDRPLPSPPDTVLTASCSAPLPSPRIALNLPPAVMAANETAALGVGIDGATEGVQVAVCRLPPKSIVSSGRSLDDTTWTLAASELPEATVVPPPGFAGEMQLDLALVTADGTLTDRRTLRFEWPPAQSGDVVSLTPLTTSLDPEIDGQLQEAGRLHAAGNLIKARAILRRYATEDARAAFMLADTYDPLSLTIPQTMPDADPAAAHLWYKKAAELGAADANARLERLEQWVR